MMVPLTYSVITTEVQNIITHNQPELPANAVVTTGTSAASTLDWR